MTQSIVRDKIRFDEVLTQLNTAQRKAVETIDGPVLVIAGPGTGKTQIIAARIGYVLNSRETQMNPENILCLTFTDSGAVAMRKRLLDFIGPTAYRVGIYTFHSFCNEVVQQNLDYFGKRFLEPISELENVQLIESMLQSLPFDHPLKNLKGDLSYDVSRVNNLFRMMKEENLETVTIKTACENYIEDLPNREEFIYKTSNKTKGFKAGDLKLEKIAGEKEKMIKLAAAAELFPEYQRRMREMSRYDFSDMILWVIGAFKKDENLLRNYQERYQYFLVDEFQDTNGAQNEVLNQLTGYWYPANVFCVGDDDQSIYEFQGARIRNIRDFAERNKEFLTKIVLTENYRSTQHILDHSKNVIDNNLERLIHDDADLNKVLEAGLEQRRLSSVQPVIYSYPNSTHEEAAVVDRIENLVKDGKPLSEIAVIYFRHAQAENIIQLLQHKGIPYRIRKRINILELPLVSQLLSIFEYIQEENKKPFSADHLLFEIMHYRFLGIDPYDIACVAKGVHTSEEKNLSWRSVINDEFRLLDLNLRNREKISAFARHLNEWMQDAFNLTLQMLFEKILNESGLLQYVLTQPERPFQLQVIQTFFGFVKECGMKETNLKIGQFLQTVEQMNVHHISLEIQNEIEPESGVNLLTCHGAKGLEFEFVFLIGCTSDKWEKARSSHFNFSLPDTITLSHDEDRLESTRRLFYVAMTRAKEHLIISFAEQNHHVKPVEASRFVYESGIVVQPHQVHEDIILTTQQSLLTRQAPVEIELFDKDYINAILQNFTLSHSSLTNYLKCPIKFYFENIIRVPAAKNDSMAFGSAIHWALKRIFEKAKNNNNEFAGADDVIADFDFFMLKNRDSFTEKQFENRLMLGRRILKEYYERYSATWNKIVVNEFFIDNVEVNGIPIKGKLDKIEFDGNNVNIVDYKTGSVKWAREKLASPFSLEPAPVVPSGEEEHAAMYGGEYWRQLVFYKILLDHYRRKKWKMISGEIDFLEKNERNEFEKRRMAIQPEFIPFVENLISSSHAKIMNHEFRHGCGKEDCSWCNFVREHFNRAE